VLRAAAGPANHLRTNPQTQQFTGPKKQAHQLRLDLSDSGLNWRTLSNTTEPQTLRLLVIGDSAVGKSSLLLRWSNDQFNPSHITTIGIDFKVRTIEIRGKPVKLQVWDTAGQDRFKAITVSYFRGAMGILLCYDLTSQRSFDNLAMWTKAINQHAPDEVTVALLANKLDLEEERVISTQKGQVLADSIGAPFIEVSAKTNVNVDAAFSMLATAAYDRITKALPKEEGVSLGASSNPTQPSCKC